VSRESLAQHVEDWRIMTAVRGRNVRHALKLSWIAAGVNFMIGALQELDPVNREGDRGEIRFYLSLQHIGSHLFQYMTLLRVHLGEEHGSSHSWR
jgi:hypothetical protein